MAALLISAVGSGDQSAFGAASVANAAQGVLSASVGGTFGSGTPVVARNLPARSLTLEFTQTADQPPGTAVRFVFGGAILQPAVTAVTAVTAGAQTSFGTAGAVNAAQGASVEGVEPPNLRPPSIYSATSQVPANLDLGSALPGYSAQNIPFVFGGALLATRVTVGELTVFGDIEGIEQVLSAAPLGISAGSVGLPITLDATRNGYYIPLDVSRPSGETNARALRFDFDQNRPITQVTVGLSAEFGRADVVNAAQGALAEGITPGWPGIPSVYRKAIRGGFVEFAFMQAVTNWPAQNVPFYFSVAFALGPVGSEDSVFGTPTVRNAIEYLVPEGIPPTGVGTPVTSLLRNFVTPVWTENTFFGVASLANAAPAVLVNGIAPTSAIGTPFIAYRIRYITPAGRNYLAFGTTVIQNWIRYISPTGADQSAYGTAVLTRGVRSLAPTGIAASLYGTATIQNKTRYYNLLGWASSIVAAGARVWDGKQYATNVTLGDGMFMPSPIVSFPALPPDDTQTVELSGQGMPIPDNQVWPLHKIESRNKQAFPEGFTSYGLGAHRVDQTIYLTIRPLGADWSVFGTAFVDQTIKKLYPEGFTSEFVPASHQIWNYKIDVVAGGLNSYVSGSHTVARGTARPVVPGIAPTSVVPTGLRVEYRVRTLAPTGFSATLWGTAILQNKNIWTYPGGIAPPSQTAHSNGDRRIPNPWISYRVRSLTGAGNINTHAVPNTHTVAQWIQYVDLAARGIAPGLVGTGGNIQFRHREIFPAFILGPYWGVTAVKRRIFVEPAGWDSSFISENAELLINTRRVYYYTGEADQAAYGNATVFNWRQDISLHNRGWYDTQWNFPVVYNLKREIVVGPYANNVDPTAWPNYSPFVDNKGRVLGAFGHISSRVGISSWIRNKADPVFPAGTDMTLWGAGTFIAHRNRTIQAQGWDSSYNERYTVVWNKADVVGPAGVGDTAVFGRPNPVANLNREVKHHSGWLGPEWGLPFIAYRVRSVSPNLFYDVPASFPEVRFNPYPITPVGIPWQGQVGGHEVRVFRREALPKSVNVHDDWFGEPIVTNRNHSVGPYGYDQSEFGRTDVQNFIRYITPEWINPDYFTPPRITYRTRTVYPTTITIPVFPVIHRIRKDSPDPPSQQRITLNDANGDGQEGDGLGIPPPDMSAPIIKLATLYPDGISEVRFGQHKVHTNNIQVGFIFDDGLLGVPTLIYTRYVYPTGRASTAAVSRGARMTPWTIYAPQGTERPQGYTPWVFDAHPIGKHTLASRNGSMYPWFGDATVTNQHRAIGPVPRRFPNDNGFDYYPQYGVPTFTLRRQYVAPTGIRSLRFGQIIFLNVPQYVNLDDETNHQGIAPSTQWGANAVGYPPVQPSLHRPVYPVGFSATLWGAHHVELLHRTITASGIPHRGNPQQFFTTPWGIALVGYPRTCVIGMGVQTLWGNNLIEFLNRPVYPVGWVSCTLEDGNFDNFKFPMKVIRKNPLVRPASTGDVAVFGTCTVSQRVRTVYSRGVDGYNSGSHSVKASSTIGAQGWESLLIGDIDRWEAGKIKAHGDDMSGVGIPRLLHPLRASSFDSCVVAVPRIAPVVSPIGIPNIAFDGPSVTNPFGCTNRVVSPLPILSNQTVPSPVVV